MARILRTSLAEKDLADIWRYVVYYSAADEGIEVYRVLHAARRREDLL